jgi:uncharacterized membrane protein YedE/YeeE
MMKLFASWLIGFIFGLGLIISGMSNPEKVLNFLDITGLWDPSLMLVMVGAISITALGFSIARLYGRSFFGSPLNFPTNRDIDSPLVIGSLLFGIGWGLAGICPGPALVLLGSANTQGIIFVVAMLAGMGVFELFNRLQQQRKLNAE